MSKLLLCTIIVLCLTGSVQAEMKCGIDHVIIDGVKIPFGTVVEVVGTGSRYAYFKERSPALLCLRVNGKANDDAITVELVASNYDWNLHKLGWSPGHWYKVSGPLMDAYDGPEKKFNIIVEKLQPIDPAPLTFADFAGRAAVLEGIAVADSRLSVGGEQAILDGLAAWPTGALGKRVVVRGDRKSVV